MSEKRVDIWMPLYIGEYMADTMTFTTEQHGAYLLLLMACWKAKGTLPTDDESLMSITKLPAGRWRAMREKLLAKFELSADGKTMAQKRSSKELAKASKVSEARSNAGKAGAAKRWQPDSKPMANAMANASQTDGQSQVTTSSSLRSEDISSALPESKYPAEFEAAWRAYPDRPGKSKADACKAWKARRAAGVSSEALQAGVERYAAFCRETGKVGTEYVKQPATFFGPGEHYLADWTPPPASVSQGKANGAPAHKYAAAAAAIYDGVFDDAHH